MSDIEFLLALWKFLKSRPMLFLYGLVIVAIVTLVTTDLYGRLKNLISNTLWPKAVKVTVKDCIIYRIDDDGYPSLQIDIIVENEYSDEKTVNLRSVAFFKSPIHYVFDEGTASYTIDGKSTNSHKIKFKDRIFDDILSVPPKAQNFKLVLEYDVQGKQKNVYIIEDSVLKKCTYWLSPVFESIEQTDQNDLIEIGITKEVKPSTKADWEIEKIPLFFTTVENKEYINFRKLFKSFLQSSYIDFVQMAAFKKKYGGVYYGILRNDAQKYGAKIYPKDKLYGLNDYEEYHILGINLPYDNFSRVKEFMHFSFDPKIPDKIFRAYAENSKYCVHLLHGTNDGINQLDSNLSSQGFITNLVNTSFNTFFEETLKLPSQERLKELVNELNQHMYVTTKVVDSVEYIECCSLNDAIFANGVLVFWPGKPDTTVTERVLDGIRGIYKNRPICAINFDCTPLNSFNENAPFAKPILVFLNYPEDSPCLIISNFEVAADGKIKFYFDSVDCDRRYDRWEYRDRD